MVIFAFHPENVFTKYDDYPQYFMQRYLSYMTEMPEIIKSFSKYNGKQERIIIFEMFYDIMMRHPSLSDIAFKQDPIYIVEVAANIEISCREATISFCHNEGQDCRIDNPIYINKYSTLAYDIASNLEISGVINNKWLPSQIRNKKIDSSSLAYQNTIDLYPEKHNILIESLNKRKNMDYVEDAVSTRYECPTCHSMKSKVDKMQTRRADEQQTIFRVCLVCNGKF